MTIVTTGIQFAAGCLALGLGIFLIAGAIRDLSLARFLPSATARTMTVLAGALLLAAGGYAARLAVPL